MSQEETPVDRMNRLLGKALTPLSLAYCKTETDMVQECLKNPILSETEGCIDAYKQMKDCFNWLLTESTKRCPKQFDQLYNCLDQSNGDMRTCKKQYDTFLDCWNKSL